MFIIVYTSVRAGEVETVVESVGYETYQSAQTEVRAILAEKVDLGENDYEYNDCTNVPANACLYIDSHGEGEDSMYKILEV